MKLQRQSHAVEALLKTKFVCPSCSIHRPSTIKELPRKRQKLERHASTLSTTAINGKRPIPARNQPLYEALTQVKTKASAYVNLSRLDLALQGLESENPVTRVAILGLNVQETARRIARLLLADALEDEQSWEKQILNHEGSHGILLRFGQPQNTNIPQRSTLPILQIPAPILGKLNVELLIAPINAERSNGTKVPAEAFLAPAVGVPTAFDGRKVTVNQPVHSTLIVASGFEELIKAVELLSATDFRAGQDKEAISLVVNLIGSQISKPGQVLVTDVDRGEKGLKALRQSVSQAITYEREWLGSGMLSISAWLSRETTCVEGQEGPAPVVQRLLQSLLSTASIEIGQSLRTATQKTRISTLDDLTKTRILDAIDSFSRAAHQELQSGLASAWSSRNWRKLSWYKLFWRVDDVGLIVSDLVTNTWLPKTERAAYEISGRLTQIGIDPIMPESEVPAMEHETAFETETAQATILNPTPPLLATATTAPSNQIVLPNPTQAVIQTATPNNQVTIEMRPQIMPVPITAAISSARADYLKQQITTLTTSAQQLVFRTLSISGMSAGLSAVTYFSQMAPTLYEAGSIFAVGTVFALYRMQSGWQYTTKLLESGMLEEGRSVVRTVVQRMCGLVETRVGQMSTGDPVEKAMLEESKQVIDRAKKEFEELQVKK